MSTLPHAPDKDAAPRTLAEELRGRSDAQLARLFAARPDIASPPPVDMTQVASRAAARTSVAWAMDRLDSGQLAVLMAMTSLIRPTSLDLVLERVDADDAVVERNVEQLYEIALVWGDASSLHVVREAYEILRDVEPPAGPIAEPPAVTTVEVDERRLAHACAGTVMDVAQRVEHLLAAWSGRPPPVLRSGGVGVREVKSASQALGINTEQTDFLVALAQASRLLGRLDDGRTGEVWAPTAAFDSWRETSIAEQWTRLARAWLNSPGRSVRRLVLRTLAGIAPHGFADEAEIMATIAWYAPRAGELRDPLVQRTLREGVWLGAVAMNAITPAGSALRSEGTAAAVGSLLPPPVDHVMVQADLTAVAPGPLVHQVARELEGIADVESRGGATVYRFTAESIRRALDRGWPASGIHALLAERSTTPVPQPLSYLVDDVARRHGTLRAGDARGYLRSDDPAELDAIMADGALASLHLVRLAPTVALTELPSELVIDRLRENGRVAVFEDADGVLRFDGAQPLRAPVVEVQTRTPGDPAAVVAAVRSGDAAVKSRPAGAADSRMSRTGSVRTMAALRDAAETSASVWLAYMDQAGSRTERIVDPMRVDAGWLTAYDHRTASVQRFAIHRITHIADASA